MSFICAQMPGVLLDPGVLLEQVIPELREVQFSKYGKWTEDASVLDDLGVTAIWASTNLECCVACAQLSSCQGAAWRQGGLLCQIATKSLSPSELSLTNLHDWSFFIKEEYLSSVFGMCI